MDTRDISYRTKEQDSCLVYVSNNETDQQMFYRLVLVTGTLWEYLSTAENHQQVSDIYLAAIEHLSVYSRSVSLLKLITSL